MFLSYLITQMSGIPPLEKYGLHKWGTTPEYRAYLKNTPVLVPYLYT
jgi:steroid 5-alpha reductase family enzyme